MRGVLIGMAASRELAFPFGVDSTGGIAYTIDVPTTVQQRVLSAIRTSKGERVFNPDYGTDLHTLIFESADSFLEDRAVEMVRESVERWVPEVRIIEVPVDIKQDDGEVVIGVRYELLNGVEGSVKTTLRIDL